MYYFSKNEYDYLRHLLIIKHILQNLILYLYNTLGCPGFHLKLDITVETVGREATILSARSAFIFDKPRGQKVKRDTYLFAPFLDELV